MKKIVIALVIVSVTLSVVGYWVKREEQPVLPEQEGKQTTQVNTDAQMDVVLSLEDEITDNTAWCGTFNLIWNDLKNDLAKTDIVFTPQLKVVENLNKGTFNTSALSEESYYQKYGTPSLALKQEIEQAIEEKFHEKSDILDQFNWGNSGPRDYFLYSMLKKEFEFPSVFTQLENGNFGSFQDVQYFGIGKTTEEEVREQVDVMYYHSKDDFAVKLLTKGNDEVILVKGNSQNTFGSMYEDILRQDEQYEGGHSFGEEDTLQIPNIKFDLEKEFKELQGQPFLFANGDSYKIEKALQTIQFELDKKGGRIKSEAGMMLKEAAAIMEEEPREFLVNDTFTIFLKEQEKDLPYFAAKIADITKVQKD